MRAYQDLKIAVAGTGYVGLSMATLLSQHHEVVAVDVIPEKVEKINNRVSPIQDEYIEKYFAEKELKLTATLDDHNCIGVDTKHQVDDVLDVVGVEEVLHRVIIRRGCDDDKVCILVCLTTIESSFKVQFFFSKEFLNVFILNR